MGRPFGMGSSWGRQGSPLGMLNVHYCVLFSSRVTVTGPWAVTRIFALGGQRRGKAEGIGWRAKKLLLSDFQLRKTSNRCFGR